MEGLHLFALFVVVSFVFASIRVLVPVAMYRSKLIYLADYSNYLADKLFRGGGLDRWRASL